MRIADRRYTLQGARNEGRVGVHTHRRRGRNHDRTPGLYPYISLVFGVGAGSLVVPRLRRRQRREVLISRVRGRVGVFDWAGELSGLLQELYYLGGLLRRV